MQRRSYQMYVSVEIKDVTKWETLTNHESLTKVQQSAILDLSRQSSKTPPPQLII